MPPQAPTSGASTESEDTVTMETPSISKSSSTTVLKTPSKLPLLRHTFHWELNILSAICLSILYFIIIPTSYRWIMHVFFTIIACEAARYYYHKGSIPGVPYTLPLVSVFAMVFCPSRFWAEMANIAMENDQGLCFNTLGGAMLIFSTDPRTCREIMTREDDLGVYAHPSALWLFGPRNLIYLKNERHKRFRAILTPALFSDEALAQYAQAQERVVRQYMNNYVKECAGTKQPLNLMFAFRSMAAASSQEAFLGPYLNDELRQNLERDILTFTLGFLCLPCPYFGGLKKAMQAKDRIEVAIGSMVPKARAYVQAGNEPRCLMERWSLAICNAAKEQNIDPQSVDCCNDDDIARTVLDFLFAAQDATNSALVYSLDVLGAHRDVLQKLRDEIESECGSNSASLWEKIRETGSLTFLSRVANQILHHKPPVPMIPYMSRHATTLAGHPIGKGTICIPSILYSGRVSGHSLDFKPDRPDQDNMFVKVTVFGAGQHKCPGRRYAESLLTVFLAVLAQDFDFERTGQRPGVDDFIFYPTIFPTDCDFVIRERKVQ